MSESAARGLPHSQASRARDVVFSPGKGHAAWLPGSGRKPSLKMEKNSTLATGEDDSVTRHLDGKKNGASAGAGQFRTNTRASRSGECESFGRARKAL